MLQRGDLRDSSVSAPSARNRNEKPTSVKQGISTLFGNHFELEEMGVATILPSWAKAA